MSPFSSTVSAAKSQLKPDLNVVSINIGGQIFQTTKQTLTSAGPNSILFSISPPSNQSSAPFIDRDPELFAVLLSLLRTGNFPSSKAKSLDLEDIISEARFYGIESLLIDSLSNPSRFDAFDLLRSADLQLNGRDTPSAITTTPFGSLHVAHGSKLTSFDWSLGRKSTVLTHFTAIDSLLALSPSLAAAGATDFSGLQVKRGGNSSDLRPLEIEESMSMSKALRRSLNSGFKETLQSQVKKRSKRVRKKKNTAKTEAYPAGCLVGYLPG